jgi:periplasmic protein TonB
MKQRYSAQVVAGRGGIAAAVVGLHVLAAAALILNGTVKIPKGFEVLTVRQINPTPPPVEKPNVHVEQLETKLIVQQPDLPPTATDPSDDAPRVVTSEKQPVATQIPSESGNGPRMRAAKVLRSEQPQYPDASIRNEEEGLVQLRIRVGADGRALAVEVFKSSGHRRLDEAALRAVRDWRFAPAAQDGNTVETWESVTVRFRLDRR